MAKTARQGRIPAKKPLVPAKTDATTPATSEAKVPAKERALRSNVEFIHSELAKLIPTYDLIRDVIAGAAVIKSKGARYLPQPNASDRSEANAARYESYLLRAVFYNVTRRTLQVLTGLIFVKPSIVTVPAVLDAVVKDATGTGVTLEQLAKQALTLDLAYGRTGILVDYPQTNEAVSRAQQASGDVRPTMFVYEPWNIVNWRTTLRNAKVILSLVVLRESYDVSDDGFETKAGIQYRVLRLIEGQYVVNIWRQVGGTFVEQDDLMYLPKDAQGRFLTEIPFRFIGVENNDHNPDAAPLYDIADLNVHHYHNSADYEESVYMVGQPTPWFAGLSESWVKEVMGGVVAIGSRAAIPLPTGASAGMLEMKGNPEAKNAMEHKEKQMVALGAKLVENRQVQRTAQEAGQDAEADASTLVSIAKNVSAAFLWALEWAAIFAGATTIAADAADASKNKINFALNTDVQASGLDPDTMRAIVELWLKEALTTNEMRARLKSIGIAFEDEAAYEKFVDTLAEATPKTIDATGNNGGGNAGNDNNDE